MLPLGSSEKIRKDIKVVKGRILKKLKSFGEHMGPLKPILLLQVNNSFDSDAHHSSPNNHILTKGTSEDDKTKNNQKKNAENRMDISNLLLSGEEERHLEEGHGDKEEKENIEPENPNCETYTAGTSKTSNPDHNTSFYRRPNLNSGSLFDPYLLEAFNQVVAQSHEKQAIFRNTSSPLNLEEKIEEKMKEIGVSSSEENGCNIHEDCNPLLDFERRCPPGGSDCIILYTTTLRGVRKTFQDCKSIRVLLCNLKIAFCERDISMHLGYREELWRILEGRVVPPRLFIRGRYIGGAEEVLGLHEQGEFVKLVKGMFINSSPTTCQGCSGMRFVPCFRCRGSRKIACQNSHLPIRCPRCNENGLILCPICC